MINPATQSATPEFTIALLMANAQAIVIRISHEIYLVYLRAGENIGPRHDNSSNADKEKHIQLDIRKHLFGCRQFAHRSTDNHQYQQD